MDNTSNKTLELILENKVLRFGDFTTKAGRQSPYFFNAGQICDPVSLGSIAEGLAKLVQTHVSEAFDGFYGPAYKGIPLCVAVASAYHQLSGNNLGFTFNRKETKDHGEGGDLIGRPLNAGERVVITEDVLSAGTSLRESLIKLGAMGVEIAAAVVIIDRQERGRGPRIAKDEIESEFGIPVYSLLDLDSIVASLWNQKVAGRVWIDDEIKGKIDSYRS